MLWWTLWRLKSRDAERRARAVRQLGHYRDLHAVRALVAALQDNDKGVRQAAATSLGQTGDARAAEPLVAVLGDPEAHVGIAAAKALGDLGSTAVEPLMAALPNGDKSVQRAVVTVLGRIGDARAVEPLVSVLREGDCETKIAAVAALEKMGDASVVAPIVAALRDGNGDVRAAAAKSLEKLKWSPKDDVQRAELAVATKDFETAVSLGVAAVDSLLLARRELQSVRKEAPRRTSPPPVLPGKPRLSLSSEAVALVLRLGLEQALETILFKILYERDLRDSSHFFGDDIYRLLAEVCVGQREVGESKSQLTRLLAAGKQDTDEYRSIENVLKRELDEIASRKKDLALAVEKHMDIAHKREDLARRTDGRGQRCLSMLSRG